MGLFDGLGLLNVNSYDPSTQMYAPDPGGGAGVGGILNAFGSGGFNPALGPLFVAAGQGDPNAQAQLRDNLAPQGVPPPAGANGTTPGIERKQGIGEALRGIQAPQAPQAEIPHNFEIPPPPRPSSNLGGDLNVITALVRQLGGESAVPMSLLSRVPH